MNVNFFQTFYLISTSKGTQIGNGLYFHCETYDLPGNKIFKLLNFGITITSRIKVDDLNILQKWMANW